MKKIKIELTPTQYHVLTEIISNVLDVIEWDSNLQMYSVGDRFIYSCFKDQLQTLKNLGKI
jgi:hypothetical protein